MKTFVQRALVTLVICALAGISALAASKVKTTATFATDTTVNGTLVKAGSYNLEFDKETGAFSVKKGDKVVATATGRLETRANKNRETALKTVGNELVAVSVGGSKEDIVLKEGASGTASN